MALTADQLNEAIAVATRYIRREITDQLQVANYLYYIMMTKQKEYVSGGTTIQQPIKDAANASQGFIDGKFGTIDTNANRQHTHATFDWKYWYHNTSITLDDFTKTQDTPESIKSLLEAKKQGSKADAVRGLSQALFGSGVDSNSLAFDGFTDLFAASGIAYGGLLDTDFSDPTTWLTEIDNTTTVVNFPNISRLISKLKARGGQIGNEYGSYKPDCMVSNFAVQDKFLSTLQAQQRFVDKTKLDAGFEGVEVNGLFWYVDDFAPGSADTSTADNFLFILSKSTLRFCYKYGLDKESPFDAAIQIPNQPVKSDQVYLAGNIVCTGRRYNGVFKTLIA